MKLGSKENPRHILGLSGGKDSSALAILIKKMKPEIFDKLEFYFTDTGSELPEVYDYLDKLEVYLGKEILYLKATPLAKDKYKIANKNDSSVPFDDFLIQYKGYLPSPNARWCTRTMKIIPMEEWIGNDHCISYIGIRADEPEREGYSIRSKNKNITPVFPFREYNIGISGVYKLLEESGLGLPNYYKWRTRSGCYFCFYQRRVEWAIMYLLYPDWFYESKKYETEHEDGRIFTWVKDKPLSYIEENAKDIISRYIKKQYKKVSNTDKFYYSLDEMLNLVKNDRLRELVDSWDIKRLHDVDGENKDGCIVCTI